MKTLARDPMRIRVHQANPGHWETKCAAHAYRAPAYSWGYAILLAIRHSRELHWLPYESAWEVRP